MADTGLLRLPVSIKAALMEGGRVCLLLNERDQWELPGGRLESGESPRECLVREVREELGVAIAPGRILDAWVFSGIRGKEVMVIVYSATLVGPARPALSGEHRAVAWYSAADLPGLTLPPGYAGVLLAALAAG